MNYRAIYILAIIYIFFASCYHPSNNRTCSNKVDPETAHLRENIEFGGIWRRLFHHLLLNSLRDTAKFGLFNTSTSLHACWGHISFVNGGWASEKQSSEQAWSPFWIWRRVRWRISSSFFLVHFWKLRLFFKKRWDQSVYPVTLRLNLLSDLWNVNGD